MLRTRRIPIRLSEPPTALSLYGSTPRKQAAPIANRAMRAESALAPYERSIFGLAPGDPNRLLSTQTLYKIVQSTPDLKAGFDSVARRASTRDWEVEVEMDPRDDGYEAALAQAATAARFLEAPGEGQTWQAWAYKTVMDLLTYDQAVTELQRTQDPALAGRTLAAMAAFRGDDFVPLADEHNLILGYEQVIWESRADVPRVKFTPEQLVVFILHPDTTSLRGRPLIESLINEIITLISKSERLTTVLDGDEIPPGLLVLGGLADTAIQQARADLRSMRGRDDKIRVIGGTGVGGASVSADWVPIERQWKDLDFLPLVKDVRRTIWRLCGIQPIELGDVEDVNRSTSEVQFEVGDSHLLGPILEMIEQAVNARILPLLIPDETVRGAVRFRFRRDEPMSPEQTKAQSEADRIDVAAGLRTRNEVRQERGLPPADGGDVLTVEVGGQIVPLAQATTGSAFRVGDITAAATIASQVSQGLMAPEAGAAVLVTMLGLTQEQANAIVGLGGTPTPPGGTDGGGGGPSESDPGDVVGPDDDTAAPGEVEATAPTPVRRAAYEDIDFAPPKGVQDECARGVAWVEDDLGGDGLQPETIRWARRLANGEDISPDKARKMRAWLARHEVDKQGEGFSPGEDGYPSPGRVAWALWGGDPAVPWSAKLVEAMDAEDEARSCCGVAHARGPHGRAVDDPDLPSDWQPGGRFEGVRTVRLDALARTVAAYTRSVEPVWLQARSRVRNAFARAWDAEDSGVTATGASDLSAAIHTAMQRLATDWEGVTSERYDEAARLARDAVARFARVALEDPDEQAALYRSTEYGYLTDRDGLLGQLEVSLNSVVAAITIGQGLRAVGDATVRAAPAESNVDRMDGLDAVLAAVVHAFDAQEHRIKNYAGALVDLAQGLVGRTLATAPNGEVWYCEWVVVDDSGTCPDCRTEGARGIIPASSFSRWPGSVTLRCQRHCRCVTVWWTEAEVEAGEAYSLNE